MGPEHVRLPGLREHVRLPRPFILQVQVALRLLNTAMLGVGVDAYNSCPWEVETEDPCSLHHLGLHPWRQDAGSLLTIF